MITEVLKIRVAQSKCMSECMRVHAHTHTHTQSKLSEFGLIFQLLFFSGFILFFTSISFLLFLLKCFPPPLSHFLAPFFCEYRKPRKAFLGNLGDSASSPLLSAKFWMDSFLASLSQKHFSGIAGNGGCGHSGSDTISLLSVVTCVSHAYQNKSILFTLSNSIS